MRRGLSFRSGNPALTKDTFNNAVSDGSNQVMTLEGTVNKSALGNNSHITSKHFSPPRIPLSQS